MLSTVYKNVPCGATFQNNIRHFNRWLIIMFNRIDDSRVKQVGPDRACAEWLLRNGASVRWKGYKNYLEDYNLLPKESEKLYLQAVDATDSAIHHDGFPHFFGCKYVEEVKLVRCNYIENDALSLLSIVKDSLQNLEVIECKNITDEGLLHLKKLINLKNLKLGNFPYIEDHNKIKEELSKTLPNCEIIYNEAK
ncbi:ATP synthase subunit s, mitochondrial [Phymastichus coffea]|uniref:ATP synthase subunit s, mitochondrial n=1 Tax=Phymastichus coffea TaxID=108790 RepID=UPI00273B6813|nr:ATP synthase subunit s, mitochondrial [Phymastichus coffea]